MARIDHSKCAHPRTPAGRAECRDLGGPEAYAREHARPRASAKDAGRCDPLSFGPGSIKQTPRDEVGIPIVSTDHCQACGSTDYEDINLGDQGYSACCNERVIIGSCTKEDCYHA